MVCLFSVWLGGFLLVVSFFCGGAFPVALHARCCLDRVRRGRETRHLPPHFLIIIMVVFWGLRVGTDILCVAPQRGNALIRSHPPHPLPAECCKGEPRKRVGDNRQRQSYCHTLLGTSVCFSPFLNEGGNAVRFFSFCVFVSGSLSFALFLPFFS